MLSTQLKPLARRLPSFRPADADKLSDAAILAAEIVEDLQATLDQFAQIAADLASPKPQVPAAQDGPRKLLKGPLSRPVQPGVSVGGTLLG